MGWAEDEAGRATAEAFRQAVTPRVARETLQAASATDGTDELARVQAPTLVVHRRDAPQVPIEVSRSLANSLPHGRLVILDGERPHLFLEDSDRVVRMLLDFFCDGLEPGGASQASAEPTRPQRARPSGSDLSGRELAVLRRLAGGSSNSKMSRHVCLSSLMA